MLDTGSEGPQHNRMPLFTGLPSGSTMNRPPSPPSLKAPPNPWLALQQYAWRAGHYDHELVWFEPLRRDAIAALDLSSGQRVIDVGCGTGLSLGPLTQHLGPNGSIVGIEQCPQMLERAQERIRQQGWQHIELVSACAERAPLQGEFDAALFHFTHDILQSPAALENVLVHLRPGARVVATGLQWASPWAWPVNAFVWCAAIYSVSTLDGLDNPWSCLQRYLPCLEVRPTSMPGITMAKGMWPGRFPSAVTLHPLDSVHNKVPTGRGRGVH